MPNPTDNNYKVGDTQFGGMRTGTDGQHYFLTPEETKEYAAAQTERNANPEAYDSMVSAAKDYVDTATSWLNNNPVLQSASAAVARRKAEEETNRHASIMAKVSRMGMDENYMPEFTLEEVKDPYLQKAAINGLKITAGSMALPFLSTNPVTAASTAEALGATGVQSYFMVDGLRNLNNQIIKKEHSWNDVPEIGLSLMQTIPLFNTVKAGSRGMHNVIKEVKSTGLPRYIGNNILEWEQNGGRNIFGVNTKYALNDEGEIMKYIDGDPIIKSVKAQHKNASWSIPFYRWAGDLPKKGQPLSYYRDIADTYKTNAQAIIKNAGYNLGEDYPIYPRLSVPRMHSGVGVTKADSDSWKKSQWWVQNDDILSGAKIYDQASPISTHIEIPQRDIFGLPMWNKKTGSLNLFWDRDLNPILGKRWRNYPHTEIGTIVHEANHAFFKLHPELKNDRQIVSNPKYKYPHVSDPENFALEPLEKVGIRGTWFGAPEEYISEYAKFNYVNKGDKAKVYQNMWDRFNSDGKFTKEEFDGLHNEAKKRWQLAMDLNGKMH